MRWGGLFRNYFFPRFNFRIISYFQKLPPNLGFTGRGNLGGQGGYLRGLIFFREFNWEWGAYLKTVLKRGFGCYLCTKFIGALVKPFRHGVYPLWEEDRLMGKGFPNWLFGLSHFFSGVSFWYLGPLHRLKIFYFCLTFPRLQH